MAEMSELCADPWAELMANEKVARVTWVRGADTITLSVGVHRPPNPIPVTGTFRGSWLEVLADALAFVDEKS